VIKKFGRLDQLVQKRKLQHRIKHDPNTLLQRYPHASMIDYHEFTHNRKHGVRSSYKYKTLVNQIKTNGLQIEGITSSEFCLSSTALIAPYGVEESYMCYVRSRSYYHHYAKYTYQLHSHFFAEHSIGVYENSWNFARISETIIFHNGGCEICINRSLFPCRTESERTACGDKLSCDDNGSRRYWVPMGELQCVLWLVGY